MVGAGEKGLASSRWAPINTGRPPYYWTSNKFRHPASSSSTSTSTAIHTTTTTTTSTSTTRPQNHAPPPTTITTSTTPATTTTANGISYTGNPYAPDATALTRVPTPWSELNRFMKIARRMRWKLPFLGQAYRAATDRDLNTPDDRAEAELMFKLDFFEYYMLLERALVHLMGVFGVKITGAFGGSGGGTTRPGSGTIPNPNGNGTGQVQSDHRFHANVLDALDDPRNPLHPVLGAGSEGDARYALARAKELRNRWKNADEPDSVAANGPAKLAAAAAARPLEDYDLERILESIFDGLEGAYVIAERYVAGVRALAAERGVAVPGAGGAGPGATPSENGNGGGGEEEAQWEFMVDAMDWEAV